MKILIAEDHSLYREGLKLLVTQAISPSQIIECENFQQVKTLASDDLDLMILDIQMPGTQELNGIEEMRQLYPFIPIIVISMLDMGFNVQKVMQIGANGFITKTSSKLEMINGIKQVLNGEIVTITNHELSNNKYFTPRQLSTLKLLVEGLSNKEIAQRLEISPTTVRDYISEIFSILGVDNRVKAAVEAKSRGIVID